MKVQKKVVPQEDVNSGAPHKFVFQFIDHTNGQRSEPFLSSWTELAEVLELRKEGEKPTNKDFILLVAVMDKEQTHIPGTPLITVDSYLKTVTNGDNNNV